MSMSLKALRQQSERKLFSLEDFQKANVVDRCYISMMMGEHPSYRLSQTEQDRFFWMEKAYDILHDMRGSRWKALQKLRQLIRDSTDHRRFYAASILEQAEQLFSRFDKVHRATQRGIIRENINLKIKYCEEQQTLCPDGEGPLWEKLIQGYWKQLIELDQVSKLEEKGEVDNSFTVIEITSDPAAIMDSMAEDAEVEQ